ncbi:hypothetical protein JG688_00011849 [Phytophthora aleatoria]|uniref:M96 mating-specific protein family n=1 Tax=Phytophthora aleatoria TaxID=2496075 RepID=A0A8J5J3S5_9STRA|nr:hypothetical protein JG688_00011849 [Phytophthora aleatoria]
MSDPNAFDASLSFVDAETFSSAEIPALASSPATFSSLTSRFSDATPSDFCEPVADPTAKLAETLAMVPLPIADQGNYAAYAGLKESQSTTKKRISAKPRKPQANPNHVRNELRFGLAFLREKAAQLEQELSSLQQKLQANSTALAARERTPTVILVPHGDSTLEVEAWKGIAGRQRKRRESAQRENSRLRIIVEKQRKIAVDLTALLRKRVDTVLAANGLASMEVPTNDVHIREGVDGKYLEFFANKVVPFGRRETAEAAWDHFKGAEKHCGNGGIYEKAAKNLDQPYTILEDFTKELYSNNSRADMKAKQIVRRYIETEPSSLAFRLSDAFPSEFLGGGGASTAETSMALPLAMAEQLASATGTGFQIGTSLAPKPQQSKLRIAARQEQRREDAVRENASDPYVSERRLCRVIDFHGDIGEFQELFQHLEDSYHELDDVLQANGLASMDISTHDVHIREGVGGKYLEFFANKALPFPLQQTSEAAWDHHKGVDKHWGNGRLYEKTTQSLDQLHVYTVLEDFTKEMFSNNLQLKQIVRRYVDPDRDIIVFVSKVSPIEIKAIVLECHLYHNQKTAGMELVGGDDDMRAFEATLSFVEEYASDAFTSMELPNLSVTSDVSSSFSFRLEDQIPPADVVPSSSSSPTSSIGTIDTSTMVPMNSTGQFSMGVSNEAPPTTQASKPRKSSRKRKPQANPNRARNELRFELAFLREKVTQLQQELQSLQPPQDKMICDGETTTLATRPNGVRSRPSSQVLCAWKGVADRQLRRREDSERENMRLRLNVEHQRKVAIDLTKLLRKRMAECAEAQDPSVKENRFTRVLDYHGDLAEFQELFPILEDTYHGLDTVLEETGLATMDIPTEDVHIREGVGGKYVEFFANKVLPFGLSDTTEAAWDHFKGIDKHCGNGELYEKAAMNLDQPFTIIEDFTKEVYSNSSRADMEMKQIVRRFVESDRDVIIFVCRGKPIEIKHKAIAGLTYHLRSYVVAKRAPASTADHNLSLLQFCSRISIDKEPGVAYDPVHVRALTRFLIGNTAGNLRCYQERIENALVDQALKRQLQ